MKDKTIILELIYDTLADNKHFEQFDIEKVHDIEVDYDSNTITFDYELLSGSSQYEIKIEKVS